MSVSLASNGVKAARLNMVELGISANTRAIIVERQRLLESQTSDVRASKRNAGLLKDLESLLQTLQRKQHVRVAQEARAASAELGGRQRRMREAQAREALGLRAELAEVHCRREQAAEQFKEELELREAAARSKQQLRVELELERFDNATRGALRLGTRVEISAAEDKVQVHTRRVLQHAAAARPCAHDTLTRPRLVAEHHGYCRGSSRPTDSRGSPSTGRIADPLDR